MSAELLVIVGIAVYAVLFYPVCRLVRRVQREAYRKGYTDGVRDARCGWTSEPAGVCDQDADRKRPAGEGSTGLGWTEQR